MTNRCHQPADARSPVLRSLEGELAEIALAAGSAGEDRQAALAHVCRAISVDAVVLNHTPIFMVRCIRRRRFPW